jgi:hypothetical protein
MAEIETRNFALPAQRRTVFEKLLVAAAAFGPMVDVREPEPNNCVSMSILPSQVS